MGMSSSQARLLSLTSRMSDLEYSAQRISNSKMALATRSHTASDKYLKALDQEKLTVYNQDTNAYMTATANNLTTYGAISEDTMQRFLKTAGGSVIVSDSVANKYKASGNDPEKFLNSLGLTKYTTSEAALAGPVGNDVQSVIDTSSNLINTITAYETAKAAQDADVAKAQAQSTNISNINLLPMAAQASSALKVDSDKIETMSADTITRGSTVIDYKDRPIEDFNKEIDTYNYAVRNDNDTYYNVIKNNVVRAKTLENNIYNNGGTVEQKAEATKKVAEAVAIETKATVLHDEIKNTSAGVKFLILSGGPKRASEEAQEEGQKTVELLKLAQDSTKAVTEIITNTSKPTVVTPDQAIAATAAQAEATTKAAISTDIPKIKESLVAISKSYPAADLGSAMDTIDDNNYGLLKEYLNLLVADFSGVSNGTSTIISSSTYNPQYKTDPAASAYYLNVFNEIAESGLSVQKDENMNDPDWLQMQLKNGNIFIAENKSNAGTDGKDNVVVIPWDTGDSQLVAKSDDRQLAKAKAEYERETDEISEKDKRFDLELKSIDTEHNATQTQMESIKKVMDKNIERTFKFFEA